MSRGNTDRKKIAIFANSRLQNSNYIRTPYEK